MNWLKRWTINGKNHLHEKIQKPLVLEKKKKKRRLPNWSAKFSKVDTNLDFPFYIEQTRNKFAHH